MKHSIKSIGATLATVMLITVGFSTGAHASNTPNSAEVEGANIIFQKTNELRQSLGKKSLTRNSAANTVAYNWSFNMRQGGFLRHNPNFSSQLPSGWSMVGENVAFSCHSGGVKENAERIFNNWVNSPGHYANLIRDEFTHIGIGVSYNPQSGCLYATQNFMRYPTSPPTTPTPVSPFIDINPKATKGQKGYTAFNTQIAWAYTNNVTKGWATPQGREFRPRADITRDAMAAFLYRQYGAGDAVDMRVLNKFSDVNSRSTHAKAIAWMAQSGYTTGYSDGTFRPYDAIQRDAVAAFLYRIAKDEGFAGGSVNTSSATREFSDVRTNPHLTSIAWMTQNDVTTGYSNGTFRPYSPVTREAVVTFLYRIEQNLV